MKLSKRWVSLISAIILIWTMGTAEAYETLSECMAESVDTAPADMTIGELKAQCMEQLKTIREEAEGLLPEGMPEAETSLSPIDARLEEERETGDAWFVLTPHRPNYLLPVAYNTSPNEAVYREAGAADLDADNAEVKFQLSLKYLLFNDIFKDTGDVYIAYTNLSYWQAYNRDNSSPFRDSNHEPEAWLQFDTDWNFFGIRSRLIQFGAWHQSNGRAEPLSRSWNRLYANFIFDKDNFVFALKPWWRIPEDEEDDNNSDIEKYLGYGEFRAAYKWHDHTFSMMLRNNLRTSGNKGAVELGWSFPLYRKLKGYVQYFNGYGQSILDYNDYANTIGVGLAFSDIL